MLAVMEHSALSPAGPQSGSISTLWWLFFYVTGAIYLLVVIFMFVAMLRRHEKPTNERHMSAVISALVAITVVILFVFLISEFKTGQKLYSLASAPNQMEIKITGHQWWWEVEYEDPTPSQMIRTANEIHIPVGVPVKFDLQSQDVIHSFWCPSLNGKRDLIPGHPTHMWLQADRPGTYAGQCAEYCGHQHAHMRFSIIAEDQKTFDAWRDAQRKSAPEPVTDLQKRGQQVFLNSTCIMCHTVDGTYAHASVGPVLTHIASRQMIASDSILNTPDNRMKWIHNPQEIKPGVIMPQNNLTQNDMNALSEYLETLK
jgi:cytochrome c oxidase subunit II